MILLSGDKLRNDKRHYFCWHLISKEIYLLKLLHICSKQTNITGHLCAQLLCLDLNKICSFKYNYYQFCWNKFFPFVLLFIGKTFACCLPDIHTNLLCFCSQQRYCFLLRELNHFMRDMKVLETQSFRKWNNQKATLTWHFVGYSHSDFCPVWE